jgi:hypothetical protein
MNYKKIESLDLVEKIFAKFQQTPKMTFEQFKSDFYQSLEQSEQIFLRHLFEDYCDHGKYIIDEYYYTIEKDGLDYYCVNYYDLKNISIAHVYEIINRYNLLHGRFKIIEKDKKLYLLKLESTSMEDYLTIQNEHPEQPILTYKDHNTYFYFKVSKGFHMLKEIPQEKIKQLLSN